MPCSADMEIRNMYVDGEHHWCSTLRRGPKSASWKASQPARATNPYVDLPTTTTTTAAKTHTDRNNFASLTIVNGHASLKDLHHAIPYHRRRSEGGCGGDQQQVRTFQNHGEALKRDMSKCHPHHHHHKNDSANEFVATSSRGGSGGGGHMHSSQIPIYQNTSSHLSRSMGDLNRASSNNRLYNYYNNNHVNAVDIANFVHGDGKNNGGKENRRSGAGMPATSRGNSSPRKDPPPTRRSLEFGLSLDMTPNSCGFYQQPRQTRQAALTRMRCVSRSLDDLDFDDEDDDDDSYVELDATGESEQNAPVEALVGKFSSPPQNHAWLRKNQPNRESVSEENQDPNSSHYIDMNQCRMLTADAAIRANKNASSVAQQSPVDYNNHKRTPQPNGGALSPSERNVVLRRDAENGVSRSYDSRLLDSSDYANFSEFHKANEQSRRKSAPQIASMRPTLRHTKASNNYVYLTDDVLPPMGCETRITSGVPSKTHDVNHNHTAASVTPSHDSSTTVKTAPNPHRSPQYNNNHTAKRVMSRSNTLPHPPKRDSKKPSNHFKSVSSDHQNLQNDYPPNIIANTNDPINNNNALDDPNKQVQTRRPYLHSRAWSDDIQLRSPSPIPEDETVLCKSMPNSGKLYPHKKPNNTVFTAKNITNNNDNKNKVLTRSSHSEESLPNHRSNSTSDDSDYNDDDYGFLTFSLGSSYLSTAMQKARSPAQAHRILAKKWRRSKPSPKVRANLWTPEGPCAWRSVTNQKITLSGSSLLDLCEVERITLQKIAYTKLQSLSLDCALTIPKDPSQKRSKRGAFSLKRKNNYSGLFENFKDKGKEKNGRDGGLVFGIPLDKCIANDRELQRGSGASPLKERRGSLDLLQNAKPRSLSKSSSSSGHQSSESLSESDGGKTSIIDALSLTSSSKLENHHERPPGVHLQTPQVPYIVSTCFKHLETYGLRTLGIFRIGSSKKRIRQLREEFDSGKDVKLNEEHNPHDVAALLKEYFRDLPDPLLTRDLYPAFVASRKIQNEEKRLQVLHLLIALLPPANRDTWWALLKFLSLVVEHSTDSLDENGQEVPGNKMDAHNLATLFGPNVLHTAKGGLDEEFQVETAERANERREVIAVIEEMINQYTRIFELSGEVHDEILRAMLRTNWEAVDCLLRRKAEKSGIEADLETSSSLYEESDSSSIPRSPNSDTEMLIGQPRTLNEALAMQHSQQQKTMCRVHSYDPSLCGSGSMDTLQVPRMHRSNTAGVPWNYPDTPLSPPPSNLMKSKGTSAHNLHASASHDSLDNRLSPPSETRFSRSRSRESDPQHESHIPHGQYHDQPHEKVVRVPSSQTDPAFSSTSDSCPDTSSSSNPLSPRSAQQASLRATWFLATPPGSPLHKSSHPHSSSPHHAQSSPRTVLQTSSTQRPLGVGLGTMSDKSLDQREKWQQWEQLAAELNQESHEQQTLV